MASTWLNVTPLSGSSGQTILTLSTSQNLSTSAKTAIVKAYNPTLNVSATTTVTIAQYSPSLEVAPVMVGIPDTGGTYQLNISANCSYVIAYPDLVTSYSTSAATGNTTITFTVPSTSASTTLVGNIVITDISGQVSKLVRLEQYGAGAHISYSPSTLTIPFSGGAVTFSVTADCIYNITKGSGSWFSVSPETGYTGTTSFTVSSDTTNTGSSSWTNTITIVGPNGNAGTISVTQENEGSARINYTADTSTVAASGETRVITIDSTDFINSSITITVQGAPGATYTYDQTSTTRGTITLNIPENTGSPRDVTVIVTGRRALSTTIASATIVFPQTEYVTVPIPYTADTSTVPASGETRTITIDTSGLVASSITIGVVGATGVSTTYNNGVIEVTFPRNRGSIRNINVIITGKTTDGNNAIADINYTQQGGGGVGAYLTFDILSGGTILWKAKGTLKRTIQYRKNGGEWVSITANTGASAPSVSVLEGDELQFKGDNGYYSIGSSASYFGGTAKFSVRGNIMSLIDSTGYFTATTLNADYAFASLFWTCTTLIAADELILPATALTNYCYANMFDGCRNMITAPALLATNLSGATYCYKGMFYDCSGLTLAPTLPATTLSDYCYRSMFTGCKSLTTVPSLPATALTEGCYSDMFSECTGLTSVPSNYLPVLTLADWCYSAMFAGCSGLTQAPSLPATALTYYCYNSMFSFCKSLASAPTLPATVLAESCYGSMFGNCTSLTVAPSLPATTLEKDCYNDMFANCTSLTSLPSNYLPATTVKYGCYDRMFQGCTSLTTAPELPATTLASSCYYMMFSGCTSLNYIKCLATDISATICTYGWVRGVASTGTFVKNSSMSSWTTGNDGIPTNWDVQNA